MVLGKYDAHGFNVTIIYEYNGFNISQLKEYPFPILVEIYGKDEQVDIIKIFIIVMKERCRCITHPIPYKYYTKLMVQLVIEYVVKWINAFPSKNGVSSTMSPAMIVEVKGKPGFNHKCITLG